MMRIGRFRFPYGLALLGILVLAAVLRFAGLDWDDGYYLHPDERFMVMVTVDTAWPESVAQYFDSATSPLNPYNTRHGTFIYGTFPMFLTKAVSGIFDHDFYGGVHLAGRAISAIADVGTVFLTAWIARRFFGRHAGLLAGFLLACTMLHIQTAHYYTVDAISVFFAIATFAATVKGWDRRNLGWFAVAGLMIGLAGASKPNFLIAVAFLGLPVMEMVRSRGWAGLLPWNSDEDDDRFPVIPAVALAGLVAFWTFRLAQPYAFAGPSFWNIGLDERWLDDLSYWRAAQSGLIDVKSSIQWVDRTPVVYILDNLVRWGMGPPLGLASLAGLILLVCRLATSRTWPSWWMLGMGGWCVAQLALYGTNMAQAQRYLMPIYPFLVVLGAGFLIELARRLRMPLGDMGGEPSAVRPDGTGRRVLRLAGNVLIAVTIGYTLFYAVAFTTLFVRPLSREQASEWIYEHVPAGSTITSEYWDDGLPMRLPGEDLQQYRYVTLDLYAYEGEGSLKLSTLIGQLNQADYIVLSSNRIIGSVPRQPERYPMASHYYEMLLNGDLGFELVAEFSQTPELFGIAFDDTNAEETLTVYEHPYVRIFQKTDAFNVADIYNELDTALGYGGVNYLPGDPLGNQMFLSGAEQADYASGGRWTSTYDPGDIFNRAPLAWWYVALQAMAFPAMPIAYLVFRRFPDCGWALAKVTGLLLVSWIAWVFASADLIRVSPISIFLAWLLVLFGGVLIGRHHLATLPGELRERWRWIVATEALFLVAFGGAAWLRALQPAFWQPTGNDETPFWFAIFNASARSPWFPAHDPWFSEGQLHLLNWGQAPWVMLTRLTGVLPHSTYNLALAGIFALSTITLWSVAATLIQRGGASATRAGWAALLAPVLAMLGSTLMLARRIGEGAFGSTARPEDWPVPGAAGDVIYGFWHLVRDGAEIEPGLARSAMLLDPVTVAANPFEAMIAGDLDSATTTLPIIAFGIAIAVAIAIRTRTLDRPQWPLGRLDIGRMALGGFALGAMMASSTWGFLPMAALLAIAIGVRVITAHDIDRPWPLVRNFVVCVAGTGLVAVIAFSPALAEWQATQRDMRDGAERSLSTMVSLHGIPLAILLVWLAALTVPVFRHAGSDGITGRAMAMGTIGTIALALATTIRLDSTLLFAMVMVLLATLGMWEVSTRPALFLAAGMTGLAMLLLIVQRVMPMTADPFGRSPAPHLAMMTWLLLGVAATVAVGWMLSRLDGARRAMRIVPGVIGVAALALLLVVGTSYPVTATRALRERRAEGELTLDATAFLTDSMLYTTPGEGSALAQDRAAVYWLLRNTRGLPVILEAATGDFQLGGRISAMTGLPTVIGWGTPERMMRPGWTELVGQRTQAVNTIYGSQGDFASIEPLLVEYGVQFIYVGSLERAMYGPESLRKFDAAVDAGELRIVYEEGPVTIYAYPD